MSTVGSTNRAFGTILMADSKKPEISLETLSAFQAQPARFIADRRTDTAAFVASLLYVCICVVVVGGGG
jgi:hypothetical protein